MTREPLRLLGLVAYAVLVAVVFVFSAYLSFSFFVRSGVTGVPQVMNLAEEDARARLADQGLKLRLHEGEEAYDDQVPLGRVVRQRPRAGSLVKRGSAVELIVSRGPRRLVVPDVVGQAAQAAQVTLAAAGLAVGRTASIYSDQQSPGLVTLQDPPAGSRVDRAAPVELFFSTDNVAEIYVMPDLVYRSYDEVRQFFDRRGFRLGSIKFEPYEGIVRGVVLRQFPLPGHPLHRRDVISLVVAAGQEESPS